MLSERTIINALILAAGLIVGPYLTIETFHGDLWPLLTAGGVTFLLVVFFFVGNRICALPMLGLSFVGNLNFLPMGLNAADLCTFVTILFYLVTYIALKKKPFKTGPPGFLYPILIVGLIILYHQRSFGLHAFGGKTEGARPAVLMLACVVSYLCAINITNPSVVFLRRLPWYCLALQIISGLPYIITTYIPQTANVLIYISNDVNLSAYNNDTLVREGTQATLGMGLQMVLLAYFPIYTWWRPERWWAAILSLICFWLVMHGGFRSTMALYGVSFVLGAWCYCSWRSLILVPPLAIAVLGLALVQSSHLISLPLAVQRSLSFLPADWDKEVKESAESSNDFRNAIERVYMKEYFTKSPLLGNGFAIDINEYHSDMDASKHDSSDGYYGTKVYIVGKIFHIGWISVYDAVGLIGMAAFIMLGINISYLSGRFIFGYGQERRSPLLPLRIWIFCNVTQNMIGYFTVFGSFSQTFTALCGYAIILAHLREIERKPDVWANRSPEEASPGLPWLGKPAGAPSDAGLRF